MKKILLFILLFSSFISISFADVDPIADYTLIDCINGNDETAVSFDSDKPYQTLKGGIESTIKYINENINISGNESTSSGMILKIKVKCSINDILNPRIDLKFNGKKYNNELIIEGVDDNSFIIDNNYFYLFNKVSSYITFKKVNFINNTKYGYYFMTENNKDFGRGQWNNRFNKYFFYGLNIQDSYIKLKNDTQIGAKNIYKLDYSRLGSYSRYYHTEVTMPLNINYFNINNSIIDIDVENDYSFDMPKIIKDSIITFKNIDASGSYIESEFPLNIQFREEGISGNSLNTAFSALISNEIDLGGNNFQSENDIDIFYINNNFLNFNEFDLGDKPLYINNSIKNKKDINITNSKELYNNIFEGSFTDNYDEYNLRRNFNIGNIGTGALGWVFKRLNDDKYFNLDLSSMSLYKEITGNDLVNGLGEIYVIFKY